MFNTYKQYLSLTVKENFVAHACGRKFVSLENVPSSRTADPISRVEYKIETSFEETHHGVPVGIIIIVNPTTSWIDNDGELSYMYKNFTYNIDGPLKLNKNTYVSQ